MVDERVAIYNCERPYPALEYKTPDAVHRAFWLNRCESILGVAPQNSVKTTKLSGRKETNSREWMSVFLVGSIAYL